MLIHAHTCAHAQGGDAIKSGAAATSAALVCFCKQIRYTFQILTSAWTKLTCAHRAVMSTTSTPASPESCLVSTPPAHPVSRSGKSLVAGGVRFAGKRVNFELKVYDFVVLGDVPLLYKFAVDGALRWEEERARFAPRTRRLRRLF